MLIQLWCSDGCFVLRSPRHFPRQRPQLLTSVSMNPRQGNRDTVQTLSEFLGTGWLQVILKSDKRSSSPRHIPLPRTMSLTPRSTSPNTKKRVGATNQGLIVRLLTYLKLDIFCLHIWVSIGTVPVRASKNSIVVDGGRRCGSTIFYQKQTSFQGYAQLAQIQKGSLFIQILGR